MSTLIRQRFQRFQDVHTSRAEQIICDYYVYVSIFYFYVYLSTTYTLPTVFMWGLTEHEARAALTYYLQPQLTQFLARTHGSSGRE